ncbi:MAG: FtsX-like permease family protein [Acidimicrobiia bacterium]
MFRLTLKNIWSHKTRLALSMLSIILGVAFLVGTLVISATLNKVFDDLFSSVFKNTDAVVRSTDVTPGGIDGPGKRRGVPLDLVKVVKNIEGVKRAEGNVGIDNITAIGKDGKTLFQSNGAPILGFKLDQDDILTQWRLVDSNGNSLSAKQTAAVKLSDNEFLLDKTAAKLKDLNIGDKIKIVTPTGPKDFVLKGIVRFGTSDSAAGATSFLFNEKVAIELAQRGQAYQSISVVANDGITQKDIVRKINRELKAKYGNDIEAITGKQITEENQNELKTGLNFFTYTLVGFAAISLVVGLIIIINSFAIIMTQRRQEYALLRAIGAKASQIRRSVILESFFVGLISSILGTLSGVGLAFGIRAAFGSLGLDLPGGPLVVKSSTIIWGLAVGTFATMLSALLPAISASRIPPVAALRDASFEKSRRWIFRVIPLVIVLCAAIFVIYYGLSGKSDNKIATTGMGIGIALIALIISLPLLVRPFTAIIGSKVAGIFLIFFGGRHAYGITGNIARRNNYRNPRRTARTAMALVVGVAVVTFFTVFASSFKATFSGYLEKNFVGDFIVSTDNFDPIIPVDLCSKISEQKYVAVASCFKGGPVTWATSEQDKADMSKANPDFLFGVDSAAIPELYATPFKGEIRNLGEDGIAVSNKFAKDHGLKLGSDIRLRLDKQPRDFKVKAILDQGVPYAFASLMIDNVAYNQMSSVTTATTSIVNLKEGIKAEDVKPKLEKLLLNSGLNANDITSLRKQQSKQIDQLLALIYVLLALSILIAAVGILNTMSLSILERRRELGMLRAIGVLKKQVRAFIRFESIIVSVMGATIGMLFGVLGSYLFLQALKEQGINKFAIDPGNMIFILIIAAVIGVVAGAWPAWRATKVDILKAVTVE